MEEQNIVSFSGGKDSTAMLLYMLENGMRVDRIINVDTTKEFPEMYDHIQKVEKYIGRKIETVKIDFDYWMYKHIKTRGPRKGEKGYGWPKALFRWCTSLKVEAMSHLLAGVPYDPHKRGKWKEPLPFKPIEYVGLAADEEKRLALKREKDNLVFPLADIGMTEREALQFCYDRGFNWGGLYENMSRVSCYLCPLQPMRSLEAVYRTHPELWRKMKAADKFSYRQFRANYSLDELEERFRKGK